MVNLNKYAIWGDCRFVSAGVGRAIKEAGPDLLKSDPAQYLKL